MIALLQPYEKNCFALIRKDNNHHKAYLTVFRKLAVAHEELSVKRCHVKGNYKNQTFGVSEKKIFEKYVFEKYGKTEIVPIAEAI